LVKPNHPAKPSTPRSSNWSPLKRPALVSFKRPLTLQHKSRPEALRIGELVEENLAQLQASIEKLKQTPEGIAELQRRIKAFGECKRIEGETSGQFYDKLHRWLHREILQTESPLHPPRQVGD
jgi:hypothetical protein